MIINYEKALKELRAWRRRDDGENFSQNRYMDSEQTLHSIYDSAISALQIVIKEKANESS